MTLNLHIPTISDHPLIIAKTRTNKIKAFIESLPAANPFEAAKLLLDELEILNRQKMSTDTRIGALETYRPTIASFQKILSGHYCKAKVPLSAKSKAHADLIKSLFTELSYGYKIALTDVQQKVFSISSKTTTALLIQRCLEAMRDLAIVHYQAYVLVPSVMWFEFNQLFLFAYQQGIDQTEIPLSASNTGSVGDTFKQILLMQLASPQNLTQTDIKRTAEYIVKNAHQATLLSQQAFTTAQLNSQNLPQLSDDKPEEIKFTVPLATELPPTAFRKTSVDNLQPNNFSLLTANLIKKARQDIQSIYARYQQVEVGQNIKTTDIEHLDLLHYLIRHWGEFPQRGFNRTKKLSSLQVNVGISAIHHHLSHESTDYSAMADDTSLFDDSLIADGNVVVEELYKTSRWISFNLSASGLALRKPSDVDENIRVGDLISLREVGQEQWALAVIKWIIVSDQQKLDVGTRLIAPNASARFARKHQQAHSEKVLLLASIPVLKQTASIVAPAGMYQTANQLELTSDEGTEKVVLTKLIERTGSYERFNFSHLTK